MAREDLSGRGKVGDVYRSGRFKGKKAANLSKAQLKRAQTARGKKVSQKSVKRATRNVANISETQFEKGRGVTRNGKLFTGQVKLASGKMATYVKGRRVVAGPKKASGGRGRGGSGAGGTGGTGSRAANIPTSRVSPSRRQEGAGRLAGSGSDGVNAKTSEGSARTSDYVHDSFSSWSRGTSTPGKDMFGNQTANTIGNNPYKTGRSPSNRPMRGKKSRLQRDAQGNIRWVKVV